jgi:hypothetical protein
MTGLLGTLRTIASWALLATAAAALVFILQWEAPEHSTHAVADTFLCNGLVAVGSQEEAGSSMVREVMCVRGRSSEDITALTLIVLGVPCLLVISTMALLSRRFLTPRQRSMVGEVRTT